MFPIGESALCAGPRLLSGLPWFVIASWPVRRGQLFDHYEMANLGHHAADRRVVWSLDSGVQLPQAQRRDRSALICRAANRASH
jgi:hypothetical protein